MSTETPTLPLDLNDVVPFSQKKLSQLLDHAGLRSQLAALSAAEKAMLLSETLPGANGFLEAIPSKHLNLAMEPEQFVLEVRRRLLMDVHVQDDFCPLCDGVSDRKGWHDVMCACGGDRVRRHKAAATTQVRQPVQPDCSRLLKSQACSNLVQTIPIRTDVGQQTFSCQPGLGGSRLLRTLQSPRPLVQTCCQFPVLPQEQLQPLTLSANGCTCRQRRTAPAKA